MWIDSLQKDLLTNTFKINRLDTLRDPILSFIEFPSFHDHWGGSKFTRSTNRWSFMVLNLKEGGGRKEGHPNTTLTSKKKKKRIRIRYLSISFLYTDNWLGKASILITRIVLHGRVAANRTSSLQIWPKFRRQSELAVNFNDFFPGTTDRDLLAGTSVGVRREGNVKVIGVLITAE